jgi:hypothetical protein
VIVIPKKVRFEIAVSILSAPVAYWLFDWAGFDWDKSFVGWVIFLSADAGMTSFVATVVTVALLIARHRRLR